MTLLALLAPMLAADEARTLWQAVAENGMLGVVLAGVGRYLILPQFDRLWEALKTRDDALQKRDEQLAAITAAVVKVADRLERIEDRLDAGEPKKGDGK